MRLAAVSHHIRDAVTKINERIQVDFPAISEARMALYLDELRLPPGMIPATFFEFITFMALLHF